MKWETIIKELDKCDLLCCRCHAETHYDPNITVEAIEWLDNLSKPLRIGITGRCPVCNKEFCRKNKKYNTYCSSECSSKSQERADYPPDDIFIKMVEELGRVKVSRKFGVSDRSIGKRYKKLKNIRKHA